MNKRLAPFLLTLLALSSVFQAASLVNIGAQDTGYPVSPYFVAQLLVASCLMLGVLLDRGRLRISSLLFGRPALWLLAFAVLAVASSLVLPRIFDGMGVYSPRGGIDDQYHRLTPLQPTASQMAQAVYLLLNVACVLFFMQASFVDAGKAIHRIVIATTLLVLFFAVWQAVSLATGIYFPQAILYSAAGRSQGFEQTMEDVRRINSTFPEASYLGTFLTAVLAYVSRYLLGGGQWQYWVLAGTIAIVALASTSTSAYVGVAILAVTYVLWFLRDAVLYGRVSRYSMVFMATMFGSVAALVYLVNTNRVASIVYNAALKNKAQSESFMHRVEADTYALKILINTSGLGVGLGSNRPSSFLAYLISNVGVFGTVLFGLFLLSLFKASRKLASEAKGEGHRALVRSSTRWGLSFCLIGMCVAVPDLSFPCLWVWIALFAVSFRRERAATGYATPEASASGVT